MKQHDSPPIPGDEKEKGLTRFLPSIPDVLGWVLAFFVLWLVYTGVVRGVALLRSVSLPTSDHSSQSASDGIGERFRSALDAVTSDVTESLDELTREAKEQKKRLLMDPAPPKVKREQRGRVERF